MTEASFGQNCKKRRSSTTVVYSSKDRAIFLHHRVKCQPFLFSINGSDRQQSASKLQESYSLRRNEMSYSSCVEMNQRTVKCCKYYNFIVYETQIGARLTKTVHGPESHIEKYEKKKLSMQENKNNFTRLRVAPFMQYFYYRHKH